MEAGPSDGSIETNLTLTTPCISTTAEYNETAAAIEFYKTYDVMTGVRIAATLGAFFGLMVILILYKSKSKTEKALEDPDFTAAAVAEVEEEERQLAAALEASAYQELNPRKSRKSIDISNMPSGWSSKSSTRFSSIAGYSSLLEPPIKIHARLPSSIDEDSPPEEDRSLYDDVYYNEHLDVPRRPSNITCSSSGSSYLERRDSAVVIGLPALPAHKSRGRRRQSSPLPEIYDFYYPIDIRVIQPTPGGSPCGSDRAIYDHVVEVPNLKPRLAPLASISSCNSSLGGPDYPEVEVDVQSYASDSVFQEGQDDNTDDEVDPFSTDSDLNSEQGACCSTRRKERHVASEQTFRSERPPCNLPDVSVRSTSKSSFTLVESPELELSLSDSIHKLSSSSITEDKISWAQETLF